jgi:hypothetical protein
MVLGACTKPNDNPDSSVPDTDTTHVVVLNEGNFMWGNASVTLVNSATESATQEVFKGVNNFPLGDVAQSMIKHNGNYFMVVNNSGKIEVVDAATMQSQKSISGLTSPRYLCVTNEVNHLAWVSDLYSNEITELNLQNGEKVRVIAANGWTEKMVNTTDQVLVQNVTDSAIYAFDKTTGQQASIADLDGEKITDIMEGVNQVYVLTLNGIYGLKKQDLSVKVLYTFDTPRQAGQLVVNELKDVAYFKETDIYQITDLKTQPVESVFAQANNRGFYGMAVDSETGNVWITDAKDFIQRGEVLVYNSNGALQFSVESGIIPQFVYIP